MSNFVNLTPHAITLRMDGRDIVVPPSGQVARVAVMSADRAPVTYADWAGGVREASVFAQIPVVANEYGAVENLPEPKYETVYIVSALVLGRVSGRSDVFAPDTGPTAVRGPNGQIEAVTRLICAE